MFERTIPKSALISDLISQQIELFNQKNIKHRKVNNNNSLFFLFLNKASDLLTANVETLEIHSDHTLKGYF